MTDETVAIIEPSPGAQLESHREFFQLARYPGDDWTPILIKWSDLPSTPVGDRTGVAEP